MKDTSVVEKGKNREPSSSISSSSSDSTSTKPSVADTATKITDDTTTTSSLTEGPTLISPTRHRITSPYTKKISCNVATPEKSTNANKYGTNTDTPNSIATTTTNTDASQTIIPNSHVHIAPVNRRDLPPSVSNVAPPSKPSSTRYTEMDTKIINYVMPILHKLLPLLTVTVFERYEEEAQFKLAEAECKALYENTKRSQMSNDVSKLLAVEQSVNAPTMKQLVTNDVKAELKAMKNKFHALENKNKQARIKYDKLQKEMNEITNLPVKGQGVSETPKTAAQHQRYNTKNVTNTKQIQKGKDTTDNNSLQSPQSTSPQSKQIKKRHRNQRQKANRKRRRITEHQEGSRSEGSSTTNTN